MPRLVATLARRVLDAHEARAAPSSTSRPPADCNREGREDAFPFSISVRLGGGPPADVDIEQGRIVAARRARPRPEPFARELALHVVPGRGGRRKAAGFLGEEVGDGARAFAALDRFAGEDHGAAVDVGRASRGRRNW